MNTIKFSYLSLLPLFLFSAVHAQVVFTKCPQKLQVYGRNVVTDSAAVEILGRVNRSGVSYTEMRCKVYRSGTLRNTLTSTLNFTGDTASFVFSPSIYAELSNYKFEVCGWNGTLETVVRTIDSVVCGDAFIITGQSNSAAMMFNGSANGNQSPFIRVLGSGTSNPGGSDTVWRMGQGDGNESSAGNTGQWGLRMARLIVDSQKVPVAIFNGGHGGQPIQFFKRNNNNPVDQSTNYGRLLKRVRAAGLIQNIRAVLWHQGENNAYIDGNSLTLDDYKSAYMNLVNDWQTDFPGIEKFYIFQIRNGCYCNVDSTAKIGEAQRQLAQAGRIFLMSTSAEVHHTDNCHYAYETGYSIFGNNIYRLLRRDLYGRDADNINPPNVKFAELSNNGMTITLFMEEILDTLTWASGAQADFKFYGATPTVSSGSCTGNRVVLSLSGSGDAVTAITYLGHQNTPEPMVTNRNGIGALHFFKFPITTPRYRDSVALAAILKANNLPLPIDSVSSSNVNGRIVALNLGDRKIKVISKDIGYMDSLKTINLSGNQLASLPREIVTLAPSVNLLVDSNYLCDVPENIKTWISKYSRNTSWSNTQLADSLHWCSGGLVSISPLTKMYQSSIGNGFTMSVKNEIVTLRFERSAESGSVAIVKLNGAIINRYNRIPAILTLNRRELPNSVCIVQIEQGERNRVAARIAPLF